MDQHSSAAAAASSKLNAQAPEFKPSPAINHVYAAAPPVRFPPPPPPSYFGYLPHNAMPFYAAGFNVTQPSSSVEVLPPDRTAPVVAANAHDKILNQVEFYFSDINLATTDQLFKYMVSDPEGYVPLSVVASFKKIKAAITGSTQLASILRGSKKLLVSEDGKNVKRQDPLTESDMEELQSRIVIAENLPEDHSHQNLMKIFSSVGSVKSIRACPPQKSNSGMSSASKAGKGDPMHFTSKFHAFVEYESVEVAEKAVMELTDEGNWRNGLKVRLLLKPGGKHTQTRGRRVGHEGQQITRNDEAGSPETQHLKGSQSENSLPQSDSQFHERQSEDNGNSNIQKKVRNNGGGGGKGKGKGKVNGQGRGRPIYPNNGGIAPPLEVSGGMEKLSIAKASAVPRMPDGTRGFSMGRGKPGAVKMS